MVANWNQVVQVLALNCVDESNEEICRNYSVTAYPTIRLFWTQVNSQDDIGKHVENLQQPPEFARDATINFLMENLKTKSAPSSWPNLNKINLNNQQDLELQLKNTKLSSEQNKVQVVGIAEKPDSFVGQQVCEFFIINFFIYF